MGYLEVVGTGSEHASARRQQRELAQRAADRLTDLHGEDRQRRTADHGQQAATTDRGSGGVDRHELAGPPPVRAWSLAGVRAAAPARRAPIRAAHDGDLEARVQHEHRAEHPSAVVVDGVEVDVEWEVVLDAKMPVTNSIRTLPTSSSSEKRSSRPARFVPTGSLNSLGITDHSFASTSGSVISPSVTWVPWVTA